MNIVLMLPVLAFCVGAIDAGSPTGTIPSSDCRLNLNSGQFQLEPIGDPLLIHVRLRVYNFWDIPDSGGSFSVDFV